ncbi:MAG: hypothetical protein HFI48_06385 [Lachnospiraceae bacterium]|nr:hypothetical protein [Lachnospiraceae bacterium]
MQIKKGEKKNMIDLYDKIKKEKKEKKDIKFNIIILLFFTLLLLLICSSAWFMGYHVRYSNFVNKLSKSIAYVNENDSLMVYTNEKILKLSEENFRGFNTYLTINGSGKETKKVPEGESILFDYGDGSLLELWDFPADKYSNRNGVFIQYTDPEGKIYSYISYKITYETVVTRYLLYDNLEITQ